MASTPSGSVSVSGDHAEFDVLVLGGTAAGCAAAIAAARQGARIVLVEPSQHLGGLMTNGLGATDIGPHTTIGGLFRQLVRTIEDHYVSTYGPDSDQAKRCAGGLRFEPSVAERLLEAMVQHASSVTIWKGWRLAWEGGASLLAGGRWLVETAPGATWDQPEGTPQRRLTAALLEAVDAEGSATGARRRISARAFVDATYEGDLAIGAGAAYRVGRESRAEYGETHAGVLYQDFRTKLCYPAGSGVDGAGSPRITGAADRRVQAFNYRLCLTDNPKNRQPIGQPHRYDRARYAVLADDVRAGRIVRFMGRGTVGFLNDVPLPNRKTDCNNHHYALLSTDWPEENYDYAEAGPERRREIARRHREYVEGLLWFAQQDEALPDAIRAEARRWGYAADEFQDNGGFPRQMYVREAARIVGEYTFSANDATRSADGGRPLVHWDSIACGGYGVDSHAARKREDVGLPPAEPGTPADGRLMGLEGFLTMHSHTLPYQLPYRIMLPVGIDGLLVPVAVSATHLGFGTIRMEPTWMALGEAAGTAAALAVRWGIRVRDVPRAALQRALLAYGQVITYLEDVPPPNFLTSDTQPTDLSAAVQFWGTRGFFSTFRAQPHVHLRRGEARRWAWLTARTVDPWRVLETDAESFADPHPATRGELRAALQALFADASPLRQSLGVPQISHELLEPEYASLSRGEACRVLYALCAAYASV